MSNTYFLSFLHFIQEPNSDHITLCLHSLYKAKRDLFIVSYGMKRKWGISEPIAIYPELKPMISGRRVRVETNISNLNDVYIISLPALVVGYR